VLKFADDTNVFCVIDSYVDGCGLQADTINIEKWVEVWQTEFNVAKCKVVGPHYGKDNIGFKYDMDGHQLREVIIERDLGIHMSSNLKVSCQCMEAYSKASQILGIKQDN